MVNDCETGMEKHASLTQVTSHQTRTRHDQNVARAFFGSFHKQSRARRQPARASKKKSSGALDFICRKDGRGLCTPPPLPPSPRNAPVDFSCSACISSFQGGQVVYAVVAGRRPAPASSPRMRTRPRRPPRRPSSLPQKNCSPGFGSRQGL